MYNNYWISQYLVTYFISSHGIHHFNIHKFILIYLNIEKLLKSNYLLQKYLSNIGLNFLLFFIFMI